MKKISYLIFTALLIISGIHNVKAVTYTDTANQFFDYGDGPEEVELYKLTVSSNTLEEGLALSANSSSSFSLVNEDYKIYSDYLYSYGFYRVSPGIGGEPVIEAPLNILINKEGLVEGTKYDVYYIDEVHSIPMSTYSVDEDHLGEVAEVVKIDGKLYIKFTASVVKPFVLEMKMTEKYKNEMNKLLKNNIYTFPAIKSTQDINDGFDFYTYFIAFSSLVKEYELEPVDEFKLDNQYQYAALTFADNQYETHIIKYTWSDNELTTLLKSKMPEMEEALLENTKPLFDFGGPEDAVSFFELDDLNYINYLKNSKELNYKDPVNYASGLKKMMKNTNYKYHFDFRAGNDTEFSKLAFGYLSLSYNGVIIPLNNYVGYLTKQIIYLPDDTEDTTEAFIAAAKKRITKYLGIDDVLIEVGGLREELYNEDPYIEDAFDSFYDVEKISDYYYYITINGHRVRFVFEKNSEKIADVEYKMKDLLSNVEVSTKSGEIPYDSLMSVSQIFENSELYQELMEKLNKSDGEIFDIKLFSSSLDQYVTKLKNGSFEVKIPLKEEFKGKNLSAFYVDDNNKIEEYPITIEGDYGVFTTPHFSTYTISLATPNPNTVDNILLYITLGILSAITLSGTAIYFKKRYN